MPEQQRSAGLLRSRSLLQCQLLFLRRRLDWARLLDADQRQLYPQSGEIVGRSGSVLHDRIATAAQWRHHPETGSANQQQQNYLLR